MEQGSGLEPETTESKSVELPLLQPRLCLVRRRGIEPLLTA